MPDHHLALQNHARGCNRICSHRGPAVAIGVITISPIHAVDREQVHTAGGIAVDGEHDLGRDLGHVCLQQVHVLRAAATARDGQQASQSLERDRVGIVRVEADRACGADGLALALDDERGRGRGRDRGIARCGQRAQANDDRVRGARRGRQRPGGIDGILQVDVGVETLSRKNVVIVIHKDHARGAQCRAGCVFSATIDGALNEEGEGVGCLVCLRAAFQRPGDFHVIADRGSKEHVRLH